MRTGGVVSSSGSTEQNGVQDKSGRRPTNSATATTPDNDGAMSGEAEFLHGNVLLTACAPAIGIILAFGGRPALLVLCFGALVAYIFDILGSVEVLAMQKLSFPCRFYQINTTPSDSCLDLVLNPCLFHPLTTICYSIQIYVRTCVYLCVLVCTCACW